MLNQYKLAIIGNGSTAVNALDTLINNYGKASSVLAPLQITIFGDSPEESCGKGFAYGNIGSRIGNLTESPADSRADYGSEKGAFTNYATSSFRHYANRLLGTPIKGKPYASRQVVGNFHAARYLELKNKARSMGIDIVYQQARVTNLSKDDVGYIVAGNGRLHGQFDRVVLAVGDVLSSRFNHAVRDFPNQVFPTPYHAVEPIIRDSNRKTVIVAFGTRSSFIDLVNGFASKGYRGKIIGISSSGQTSWQARESRGLYPLQFLTKDKSFKTIAGVLAALKLELIEAKKAGAFVPDGLLQSITPQRSERLRWNFDLGEEASNADKVTYHDVVQVVNWEKIYESLNNPEDRKQFNEVLSDFILYNRVNRVVPRDYNQFVKNYAKGKVEFIKSSFGQDDIHRANNGRLNVTLANGSTLPADFVVNCAIGPAPANEQMWTQELLSNLAQKHWLSPRDGSGFNIAEGHQIDILGAQARPYTFTGLGLESYGRQIGTWAAAIMKELASQTTTVRSKLSLIPRRSSHG